jgi:hypothetical protein
MQISVECVSGYKADELPVSFHFGSRDLLIDKILEHWYEPDYSYFKVQADDSHLYILKRYGTGAGELIYFKG